MKRFRGEAWRDETDGVSSGRILLWIWTITIIGELLFNFDALSKSQPLLVFISGIYLVLIGWCAGPRIMMYLGPQLGNMLSAVGQARIKDPGISSDVQEIVERKKTLEKG